MSWWTLNPVGSLPDPPHRHKTQKSWVFASFYPPQRLMLWRMETAAKQQKTSFVAVWRIAKGDLAGNGMTVRGDGPVNDRVILDALARHGATVVVDGDRMKLIKPVGKGRAFAFECCVIECLNRTFEPSPPGRCVHCGGGDRNSDALLPIGTESAGRIWLHKGCREVWHANRRAKAFAALADLGICHAGTLAATEEVTAIHAGMQHSKPAGA
jgi:hypothetical protein